MQSIKEKPAVESSLATDTEAGIKQADYIRRTMEQEREWRRLNPDLWNKIEQWAVDEAQNQRPFSMQLLAEKIRFKDYADAEGNPVKVSNNFLAIWARRLIKDHPELIPFVRTRPSVFDGVEL